jgi:predicted dehydrogenase
MNVGLVGTGAIAHKHAESYREINYRLVAVSDLFEDKGRAFASKYGAEFAGSTRDLCARPDIDYIDACTFPDSHLEIVKLCVEAGKPVLVQKPIALTLEEARAMIELTQRAGLTFGVVSQHRFDDASIFLKKAIDGGRLGKILQADGYVKWHRPQSYYDKPGKGTWKVEGGGALINQGIHTVDLLQYFAGPVREIFANWQLGAAHKIEAEDVVNALVRYESGATGVIQAATAVHPGYPERLEIHGTKGSATITGDHLTAWDVEGDSGEPAPVSTSVDSGASDPMAISLEPIKRQFLDFGNAVKNKTNPLVDGEQGYRALQIVLGVYDAARSAKLVTLQ